MPKQITEEQIIDWFNKAELDDAVKLHAHIRQIVYLRDGGQTRPTRRPKPLPRRSPPEMGEGR